MKHTIIYITGLGDRNIAFQRFVVSTWSIYNVRAEVFQMRWADKKSFSEKLSKLLIRIDELVRHGHTVSLVGVSAGASVAITAFALRKENINGVVLLCGKVHHPETVGTYHYDKNPAFKTSLHELHQYLSQLHQADRAKLLSIHPFYDQSVPVKDTIVAGAKEGLIPGFFHVPSIGLGITIFSYKIVGFLKKLARKT